jgi:hypothetical protein
LRGDEERNRAIRSRRQAFQEPGRADDVGSTATYPFGETAVRGDEHDRLVTLGREGHESVVSMSRRMDDLDTVRDSLFDALLGLPLQDQHHWSRQGPFHDGASHACDEIPSSTGSVTPPPSWPRTDNVRAIYEEHPPSFAQRERAALCPG